MKALTFQGPMDVRVEKVPDPAIQEAEDIIVRVTATAICGSDLHIFRGRIPGMRGGDVLGHEFMGIVEETGSSVTRVARGDRVVVPFTISCGECYFCERDLFAACERSNPARGALLNRKGARPGAGLFGYSHLHGGYAGGQAEFVRVPFANTGPFKVGEGLADEQVLFLSDILPTGYQAAVRAGIRPGATVAIFGAGPVGCMAAAAARFLGAERLFMVDHHPYRLAWARQVYGAETINFDDTDDPAEHIVQHTAFRGVDATIDAVGLEARGSVFETAMTSMHFEGSSGKVVRQAIAATRRGGVISMAGIYAGLVHGFLLGEAFDKGLTFRMGQTNVQHYMPELLQFILAGRLRPEAIITHRLPLTDARRGYEIFNAKQEDCRKVVLLPGATPATA